MSIETLLVDDEKALLEQAEIFLDKIGDEINIHPTTSARKALGLMDEENFDIIVSDHQMPEMNGLELLDFVRNKRDSDIPFIIFTGKGREDVAMEALNLGADRYLHKGGDPKTQYGVLKQAIIQEVLHFKAEVALRESEEKYRNLFNDAPVGIIYYDKSGIIIECNEKFDEFMSSSKEALIDLNMIDELENEEVIEGVRSSLENGKGYFEGWYTSITGGEKRYGRALFKGLKDRNGEIERGICIVEDITDKKEAEEKLKESEKKYRRIIEQMDDVYYRTDMEGKLVEVSPHGEELLGFEEDKMIGKKVTTFYSNKNDRAEFLEILKKNNRVKNFETVLESKDEKAIQVLINSHYVEGQDGEPEGIEGIISDITEMKKTKKKLENRNEKIKSLHDKAMEFEKLESEDDICELVVEASEKILGFYACGISFKEDGKFRVKADKRGFYKKGDAHPIEGIAGKTFREKKSFLIRDMDRKKEAVPKKESYRSAISIPFGDIGVFQALSEDKDYFNEKDLELAEILIEHAVESLNRLISEKKVRKNKKRYENLFEENPEALVEVDEDFKIIDANTRFKDLFGYKNEKIEGGNIKDLISLQTKIGDAEDLSKGTDEGSYFENETIGFNKEGKEIPVSIKWKKIQEKNKTKFVGVCRDISKKKKAGEEPSNSADNTPTKSDDPKLDPDGLAEDFIQKIESHPEKLQGYEKEKKLHSLLESMNDWVWEMNIEGTHTYSNSAIEDLLGYEKEEVVGSSAWKLWPEDAKEEINEEDFKETLKKGEGWEKYKGKFQHKDGLIKVLESTAIPIYDNKGKLKGYRGIDRDITARSQAEEREEFLHSLLRHDVSNKIQLIDGYLTLLGDLDLFEEAEGYVEKCKGVGKNTLNLIEKIRKLKKVKVIEEEEMEKIVLDSILNSVIFDYENKLKEKEIQIDVEEDLCTVEGGYLLEEVFSNLIENSIRHSDCNKIEIKTEVKEERCVVVYRDDGSGIREEDKEKVFKKGFRAGEKAGSGVGMYLVKEIVKSYGGSVEIKDSELGGVRVDVHLKKV